MAAIDDLLDRLERTGIPVVPSIREAMENIDISRFTEFDISPFFHDRPLMFHENLEGGVKTISAPHMIVTLLHHMELKKGQDVLVIGAKGGYLTALCSYIVNPGRVSLVDPDAAVIEQVGEALSEYSNDAPITIRRLQSINEAPSGINTSNQRVLITGALKAIPNWVEESLSDGGFVICPLGSVDSQELVKRERQGDSLFDTPLGSVLFGPVDIAESVPELPGPHKMAELLADAGEVGSEMGLIHRRELARLRQLTGRLRSMPPDSEGFNMPGYEGNPNEMEGIFEGEAEWLSPLWPILEMLFDNHLQSPGSPKEKDLSWVGTHKDLIP